MAGDADVSERLYYQCYCYFTLQWIVLCSLLLLRFLYLVMLFDVFSFRFTGVTFKNVADVYNVFSVYCYC